MKKTKVFIDISPAKNKRVCSNCIHFNRFGVVSGLCMLTRRNKAAYTMPENGYYKSFEKKGKK